MLFINYKHLLIEVLEPHTVLLVQEIDVPEAVLFCGSGQVHLQQHLLVEQRIQLPEQLLPLDGGPQSPAQDPTKIGPNY